MNDYSKVIRQLNQRKKIKEILSPECFCDSQLISRNYYHLLEIHNVTDLSLSLYEVCDFHILASKKLH